MEKFVKNNVWRTIVLLVTVLSFSSCTQDEEDLTGDKPVVTLVKPEIKNLSAENVTATTATLKTSVKSEIDAIITIEYRKSDEISYSASNRTILAHTTKDKVFIDFDFDVLSLDANSEYVFRVKALNKAGETISNEVAFSTWVVKDYDGNLYHVIKIGNQYWLKENLKATHYADGTEIPNITNGQDWDDCQSGSYCWYDNDIKNKIYGALYNLYAADNSKGFIEGYSLPEMKDFEKLISYLGGGKTGIQKMMDNSGKYWSNPPLVNNSSGFTALPGGYRVSSHSDDSPFAYLAYWATFFTKTSDTGMNALTIYKDSDISIDGFEKETGCSVRLIKK